jgi:CubicO group peptidase (beta-lactamase class C family)
MGDALRRDPTTEPPHTIAGLMGRIVTEPLQFEPGSRFGYSNSGFIVLGAAVERITGRTYRDYVHENVFEPAGMADTDVRVYRPRDVPGMALGYMRVGRDGQPMPMPMPPGSGPPPGPGRSPDPQAGMVRDNGDLPQIGNPSGGAYSTVADMFAFAGALTGHRLLSPELTDIVLTGKVGSTRPGGSPEDTYAYGFIDQKVNGVRIVGHDGGIPGYEAQLDVYPKNGHVVVILANQDGVLVPAIRKSEEILTR